MNDINKTGEVIEVARGITEYGFLAIAAAGFVVIALIALILIIYKHFQYQKEESLLQKKTMSKLTENSDATLHRLNVLDNKIHDLHEAFTTDEFAQASLIIDMQLSNTKQQVCAAIGQIKEENNLDNREHVEKKIKHIINNIHTERNIIFDRFKYKNMPLSAYTLPKWKEEIIAYVLESVYDSQVFKNKYYMNELEIMYEGIKNEFIENLKKPVK